MRFRHSELFAVMSFSLSQKVRCQSCLSINRVGFYGLSKIPRCGKCGAALPEGFIRPTLRWLLACPGVISLTVVIGLIAAYQTTPGAPPRPRVTPVCATITQPPTGLYANYDTTPRVSKLNIEADVNGSYFVKLEEATTRRSIMTLYLRRGDRLVQDIPEGDFVIKYATGDNWCGDRLLFGPNTSTQKADRIFSFSEDRGYTVELIRRPHGNLRTSYIERDEF